MTDNSRVIIMECFIAIILRGWARVVDRQLTGDNPGAFCCDYTTTSSE
jgi:hypothetical protein